MPVSMKCLRLLDGTWLDFHLKYSTVRNGKPQRQKHTTFGYALRAQGRGSVHIERMFLHAQTEIARACITRYSVRSARRGVASAR